MKKLFVYTLGALLVLASCAKEQEVVNENTPAELGQVQMTFTGVTDDGLTKTTLSTSDWGINWSTLDHIAVLAGGGDATPSDFRAQDEGRVTTFNGSSEEAEDYYAVFPFNAAFNTVDGTINASLPTSVAAVEGSFGADANLSFAKSSDKTFLFKNVGALVGVTVGMDNIDCIKLEALGTGNQLTGTVHVTMKADGTINTITKASGEEPSYNYATLTGSFENGKTYYFVVLPGTYANGFRLTFYQATRYVSFSKGESKTIERNDNLYLGSFSGSKWKEEALTIKGDGAAEAGQALAYVGKADYWKEVRNSNNVVVSNIEHYSYNYEIFTRLNNGKSFYFESAHGTLMALNNTGTAVGRITHPEDATYCADSDGVYRIRMVLPEGIAEVKKVDRVVYSHYNVLGADMTYDGHGVWSYSGIPLKQGPKTWDNRYKFNIYFTDTDSTNQWYGRQHSNISPTYDTTDPSYDASYFYVQPSNNVDAWEPGFRFPSTYESETNSRYFGDIYLYMNNEKNHYTHEVTNILDSENLPGLGTNENLYVGGTGAAEANRKFGYNADFDGTSDYEDESALSAPSGYDYEIFISLNGSKPVYFYTSEGHLFTFNSDKNGLEKIAKKSDATNCAWEDGEYRIRIKSSDLSASIFKVKSVEFYQSWSNTIIGALTYDNNGSWKVDSQPVNWETVSWEWDRYKDTRYKFKVTFVDSNSTETVQAYGCITGGLAESGSGEHLDIQPVKNDQWSKAFKIPYSITDDKTSGETYADIHLYLNLTNSRGVYTHTWAASNN